VPRGLPGDKHRRLAGRLVDLVCHKNTSWNVRDSSKENPCGFRRIGRRPRGRVIFLPFPATKG
jgi:hypothetical protein